MSALLELVGLEAGYGDAKILHGIDLEVATGGVTAIIGSNGAGKTTLFRSLVGLIPCDAGSVLFDGQPLNCKPSHERVALGLVLVPEGRLIFAEMSVEENLRTGTITARAHGPSQPKLDKIYEMFPRLRERRKQLGGTLSGGEQQMLAIGRGLMSEPRLLLLDEPTLGLAPGVAKQIFGLLPRFVELGVSVLIAEQDVYRTLEIASSAYVFENGRVTAQGSGAELLDDPAIRASYLGQ